MTSRKTSCYACVESKRRCDKALPSCSRCFDRDIDCMYPIAPIRRRRVPGVRTNDSTFIANGMEHNLQRIGTNYVGSDAPPQSDSTLDVLRSLSSLPTSSSLPGLTAADSASSSNGPGLNEFTPSLLTTTSGEPLKWFHPASAWVIATNCEPPTSFPTSATFSNFIRGLRLWLDRFLDDGHNPFIHRHLYPEGTMPHCLQDAFSAISIARNTTHENEHITDEISSSHISKLVDSQSNRGQLALSMLSTKDHLARTQALLIHLLLALFSSSIPRRTRAESLIHTLLEWTKQLWDSAMQDANLLPQFSFMSALGGDEADSTSGLFHGFVLSESVRRTWLLSKLMTGVYYCLKGDLGKACGGDIRITTRAELWDATSPARWEILARSTDPLFIYSLNGQSLVRKGVSAAEVDEFSRHVFTVLWGMDKVEDWVVRTGDAVSILY